MNGTTGNNTTQTLYPNYHTLIPVIPGKQVHFKTKKEQAVKHYDELIVAIIKVMDIQYVSRQFAFLSGLNFKLSHLTFA